ncbi:MAG TPA: oxidoreductase, partial [Planctomycetaceae bacterium]|nr:oxidoreductase [Planctomycetaceae bacterium]HBC63073.1 oxidoreductase [Planctomycetaceae bacterium]
MLRIGFVGLDSSHCTAFARLLLEDAAGCEYGGARITAGWPGGSADFP